MAESAPLDIDFEIAELDTRLERLRSLYEQYFLGIERIEPTVARKDVDRRFWQLRKEKIRNTARRYKLQVLIQRYNTFQQYWKRICREIENGTYMRHMLKAEKILANSTALTIASKRRRGAYAKHSEEEEEEPETPRQPETAESTAPEQNLDEILGLKRAPALATMTPAANKPRPRVQFQPLDIDIDDLLGGGAPISARPPPVGPVRTASPAISRPGQSSPPISRPGQSSPISRPGRTQPSVPPGVVQPSVPPGVVHARPSRPPGHPSKPPLPARTRRPGPAATRPPPAAAGSAGVPDERVRALHQRLTDAKRQLNDLKSVSMEGLAKSLKATEENLRKQHGPNRKIDFDVVIKNGKALVKPIVR